MAEVSLGSLSEIGLQGRGSNPHMAPEEGSFPLCASVSSSAKGAWCQCLHTGASWGPSQVAQVRSRWVGTGCVCARGGRVRAVPPEVSTGHPGL